MDEDHPPGDVGLEVLGAAGDMLVTRQSPNPIAAHLQRFSFELMSSKAALRRRDPFYRSNQRVDCTVGQKR